MNNINPIDVIKDSIGLLKLNRLLELQIDVNQGEVDDDEILIHHIWYFSFINGQYHIYDENNIIFDWDYLDDAIDFFENSNESDGLIITEILLHHEDNVNANIELYLCEENDCYYQRSRSAATKIQKKWKSHKFNKQKKRLIKNIRNRETGLPFSFGKRTYKFNSDIKYLESLK